MTSRFETHERARALRQAQTSAEKRLWFRLNGRPVDDAKFVRQEPIGPYFVDFVCRSRRLVVEVDGATHSTDAEVARDARRSTFLEERGYRILRFTNEEVYKNMDGVLETIFLRLQEPPLPRPARGERRSSILYFVSLISLPRSRHHWRGAR